MGHATHECEGEGCCKGGTEWRDGGCVASYDGCMKACEDERGAFSYTCGRFRSDAAGGCPGADTGGDDGTTTGSDATGMPSAYDMTTGGDDGATTGVADGGGAGPPTWGGDGGYAGPPTWAGDGGYSGPPTWAGDGSYDGGDDGATSPPTEMDMTTSGDDGGYTGGDATGMPSAYDMTTSGDDGGPSRFCRAL